MVQHNFENSTKRYASQFRLKKEVFWRKKNILTSKNAWQMQGLYEMPRMYCCCGILCWHHHLLMSFHIDTFIYSTIVFLEIKERALQCEQFCFRLQIYDQKSCQSFSIFFFSFAKKKQFLFEKRISQSKRKLHISSLCAFFARMNLNDFRLLFAFSLSFP